MYSRDITTHDTQPLRIWVVSRTAPNVGRPCQAEPEVRAAERHAQQLEAVRLAGQRVEELRQQQKQADLSHAQQAELFNAQQANHGRVCHFKSSDIHLDLLNNSYDHMYL
jgi:hypothetical protein